MIAILFAYFRSFLFAFDCSIIQNVLDGNAILSRVVISESNQVTDNNRWMRVSVRKSDCFYVWGIYAYFSDSENSTSFVAVIE